jgi:hypothetical protein
MTIHNSDPEQVIVSYLSQPSELHAALYPFPRLPAQDYVAKAGTFHFLKKCFAPPFQVHTFRYENNAGMLLECSCCLEQDSTNQWRLLSYLEIKVEVRDSTLEQEQKLHAGQPWVQLNGGGGGPFWAIGTVISNGFEVTSVRLRSKNGFILEDSVQDGYVAFVSEQKMQPPVEAEMYDSSGILLRRYIWQEVYNT